jgi:hypothetical protein
VKPSCRNGAVRASTIASAYVVHTVAHGDGESQISVHRSRDAALSALYTRATDLAARAGYSSDGMAAVVTACQRAAIHHCHGEDSDLVFEFSTTLCPECPLRERGRR